MSELNHAIINEIKNRYDSLISDEVKVDYSFSELAGIIGEKELVGALCSGSRIRKCKCCGKPFVAHRSNERYCSGMADDKRTCKDIGPLLVRSRDPVTFEFDKARRLHLWRRSAAGKDDAACRRYEEWLSFALEKEILCRAGDCSLDEFKAAIGTCYSADVFWDGEKNG